ncbi:MAG: AAA family ATPase [Candidatus Poribacteria bacterium]|nr:AAA family ATPase [Candidatus Poribacteria bacterium]
MKLTKVRISNFQCIHDSTEFDIGDITCLVGKNESGKTALLKALYRLNPINPADGAFEPMDDYPRENLEEYEIEVATGKRKPAQVVQAAYTLDSEEINAIEGIYGPRCLKAKTPTAIIEKGYSNQLTLKNLDVDTAATLKHLLENAGLRSSRLIRLLKMKTVEEKIEFLINSDQTKASEKLLPILQSISQNGVAHTVFNQFLLRRIPLFFYFDEYYQMKGQENLDALNQRTASNNLDESDYPLLGLLDLADIDLAQILNLNQTERLFTKFEKVIPDLTETAQKVLDFWSQNQHHRIKFDIRRPQSEDASDSTNTMHIWIRVEDARYGITTSFGAQSRGFMWFFSFLAWYQKVCKDNQSIILLLDEPGLSLHAKAQADLLRYFEEELAPDHQVIYTTHSPFMIDPWHFDRVRIVQDLRTEPNSKNLPADKQGTKVIAEVLEATPDSLFPLQGALGYEIYQTLFIGPNTLVVEGASDFQYLKAMSGLLQQKGKAGLSSHWTLAHAGGFDKVPTFVALIGANTKLNIAVLIDSQKKDQQKIKNLYKKKLLKKNHVLTYADFVGNNEADVEDMFDPEFYLKLVNEEFGTSLTMNDLPPGSSRIVRRLKDHFENSPLPNGAKFNHYRPALYLSKNLDSLAGDLTESDIERFQEAFDALNKLLVTQLPK